MFIFFFTYIFSFCVQELTDSAYHLYNKMVFVSLDVDEFPQWASHFVPQGYSRQIYGEL